MVAGNVMGAVKIAPPTAVNVIPMFRMILNHFGVGALTRSTKFKLLLFIVEIF